MKGSLPVRWHQTYGGEQVDCFEHARRVARVDTARQACQLFFVCDDFRQLVLEATNKKIKVKPINQIFFGFKDLAIAKTIIETNRTKFSLNPLKSE